MYCFALITCGLLEVSITIAENSEWEGGGEVEVKEGIMMVTGDWWGGGGGGGGGESFESLHF